MKGKTRCQNILTRIKSGLCQQLQVVAACGTRAEKMYSAQIALLCMADIPHTETATPVGSSHPKRLPPLLRKAWYGLNQAFRQRIVHLGITPDQFSILRWLSEGDPQGLTQRALTNLMASDPNTITSTLNRMEKSRLVSRQPHEIDRRAHRVRIEPAGQLAFDKGRKVALELQAQVLEILPPNRRSKFLGELEAIANACGVAAERPAKRGSGT